MKIKIQTLEGGQFIADCSDLPGSPPIGMGSTKEQAVALLILRMYCESSRTRTLDKWMDMIDMSQPIAFEYSEI